MKRQQMQEYIRENIIKLMGRNEAGSMLKMQIYILFLNLSCLKYNYHDGQTKAKHPSPPFI